jgi:hypothetical protein
MRRNEAKILEGEVTGITRNSWRVELMGGFFFAAFLKNMYTCSNLRRYDVGRVFF